MGEEIYDFGAVSLIFGMQSLFSGLLYKVHEFAGDTICRYAAGECELWDPAVGLVGYAFFGAAASVIPCFVGIDVLNRVLPESIRETEVFSPEKWEQRAHGLDSERVA